MKGAGMRVVSLRGVNFEFGLTSLILSKTPVYSVMKFSLGLHAKKYRNIYLICIFLIRFNSYKQSFL